MLPCNARGGAGPVEGNLPLFGFAAIMCSEWFSTADSIEENVIMANRDVIMQRQQLESAEPQLGAPSQSSFSLPPPPPIQMF